MRSKRISSFFEKEPVRRSSCYRVFVWAANKRSTGFGGVARPSSNGQSPVVIG